ncbi:MAG: NAD-dependent epimerase/dehydratase, partial [Microgenomates group bacterium Gr01-1014_93]
KIAKIEKSKILKLYIPLSLAKAVGSIFDVIQKFGITMPLSSQRVKFLTENRRYSIDKVRTVLGFNPKIGLEEGLKRTYKWYKENRHL